MHTIEAIALYKELAGTSVLNNVNLSLKSGEIYGIVGKNGSGKTMLFRALSGLIRPSSGKILLDGKDIHEKNNEMRRMGLVIENAGLYPGFTGLHNLMLLAKINNYIGKSEIMEALKRVGLNPADKRTVRKYSLGMKQRLAIAQAIMERADFIFLDEPTNGLDTEGIALIHHIILEEAQRGALILIASHNREDIEKLCSTTYTMQEGKLKQEELL